MSGMHEYERELSNAKEKLNHITVPEDALDRAILAGIEKGKSSRARRIHARYWIQSSAAAILFLMLLAGAIHQSDLVAGYVRKLPGMEKIVELVHQDKGLVDLVNHNFVQKIGKSDSHGGVTFTVENIIADDQQMFLYYKLSAADGRKFKDVKLKQLSLQDIHGEKIKEYTLGFTPDIGDVDKAKTQLFEADYGLTHPLNDQSYQLEVRLGGDPSLENEVWRIPITLDHTKMGPSQTIRVNKTASVEGQKVFIKNVAFSPTRVAVSVDYPEGNSKQILNMEDLELVDEKGEAWSRVSNGTTRSGEGNHVTYYLESNYFKKPKRLYLVFHKLQALDKDELEVVVDPAHEKLVKAPKDGKLEKVKYVPEGHNLEFTLKGDFRLGSVFTQYMAPKGEFKYLHEDEYRHSGDDKGTIVYGFADPLKDPNELLTLKLNAYPAYIHGDVKIRLK
ncbi:DUF4179 domain-containing protein [Falsibacillus albus]|uniref:DUF4179 domain-containing protein n=1 Tax=Falsibacillus albus TaxID=2478915 RepID=A0A3L7JM31_9BACI|nr:DUF4179 domain-containing protein [Falsibacillus albus]RLQ91139.1 DUF4179 domain-containing protein [Falsibacillus albus]